MEFHSKRSGNPRTIARPGTIGTVLAVRWVSGPAGQCTVKLEQNPSGGNLLETSDALGSMNPNFRLHEQSLVHQDQ